MKIQRVLIVVTEISANSSHGFHLHFTRKYHTHAKFAKHGKQRKAVGKYVKTSRLLFNQFLGPK